MRLNAGAFDAGAFDVEAVGAAARDLAAAVLGTMPNAACGIDVAVIVVVVPSGRENVIRTECSVEVLRERFGLTPREAEVAVLLSRGLRNDAVARHIHVTGHTARRHTERVLAKLGIASRAEAAALLAKCVPDTASNHQ